MSQKANRPAADTGDLLASLVSPAGYILAVSYPVLALSTGARAICQLALSVCVLENLLASSLSALAALFYLVATIGFAYRRQWSWWLSVAVLGLETALTLVVGTWSYVNPPLIGSTVWRHFGADYGFFPLFQPLLGLLWLFWRDTLREYGFRHSTSAQVAHTQ